MLVKRKCVVLFIKLLHSVTSAQIFQICKCDCSTVLFKKIQSHLSEVYFVCGYFSSMFPTK